MKPRITSHEQYLATLPGKPMAAAVLFTDDHDRQLLVEITDKSPHAWELPGGAVEKGESPYDAAVREVAEKLGLTVVPGRILVIDWVPPDTRTDRLMIVFDGGPLTSTQTAAITLAPDELRDWAWSTPEQEAIRLSPLLARRAAAARHARHDGVTAYLEAGAGRT
ncbi:8-oxo-dGTP pyrophosphatase MutT (NUDIX family) [Hamadaea flava]|uniref:NUDIX domain-containing protein n=1 Tax=Hamadaea flava TaxID=1742688 RepID=A0ABV8LLF6_9ACTN|nr:NUDIX hydrolase [Hamadaea flava]MCP2323585.1 8-oxo-dGTP pyrophosphatase MutT (NUDIX family) [Hamadaea flava]